MFLKESQIKDLVEAVFQEWKTQKLVTFKTSEKEAFEFVMQKMRQDQQALAELDRESKKMVEDLERQQPGLDRHKMFIMVKQRLAKQKGIVL